MSLGDALNSAGTVQFKMYITNKRPDEGLLEFWNKLAQAFLLRK